MIPTKAIGKARLVDRREAQAALEEADIGQSRGVYVFAMSVGGGVLPWYVGKTTKSFASECFTDNKLLKYNEIVSSRKGKPLLYCLELAKSKGKLNARAVDELESLMIGIALRRNSNLLNLAKVKQYEIIVPGVLNSTAGKPKNEVKAFRQMMGLAKGVGLR